jgi:hypothetical protein
VTLALKEVDFFLEALRWMDFCLTMDPEFLFAFFLFKFGHENDSLSVGKVSSSVCQEDQRTSCFPRVLGSHPELPHSMVQVLPFMMYIEQIFSNKCYWLNLFLNAISWKSISLHM